MHYVIADTHFYCRWTLEHHLRPFLNVEEMNREMIKRWNNVITKDDVIYHLGDVSRLNLAQPKIADVINQLNGRKILLCGNHDEKKIDNFWLQCGFSKVFRGTIDLGYAFLSHKPIKNPTKPNIHGHLHERNSIICSFLHLCVSVERINYKPILLSEVYQCICKKSGK